MESAGQFADQVAVITGAAKGIGQSTARAFAREGAGVVLLDMDSAGGESLAQSIGKAAMFIRCDVGRAAEVDAAFDIIVQRLGHVDILVNNAGIQHYGTVTETSEAEWDRVMSVNLKSAFLCAKRAIPLMTSRPRGVVINVASVQAFVSQTQVAPYTTSKTALLGLTRSIAVDYAPKIRCVAVCPGSVDTPMLRDAIAKSPNPEEVFNECMAMHPLKRVGSPEEIAELILYLCGPHAGFITGQAIRIDGGLGLSIAGSKRD
jgi:NAD(P)-dependent dehydrogenase (short-subunit alcohol dehydrogenase family)